ncbi:MAG: hypothetical protein OHK0024_00790 [Thalassobaculales bacterium]
MRALLALLLALWAAGAAAQPPVTVVVPPDHDPAAVQRLIEAATRSGAPVRVELVPPAAPPATVGGGALPAPAPAALVPEVPASTAPPLVAAIRAGLWLTVAGADGLPGVLAGLWGVLAGPGAGGALAAVLACVALGALARAAARRLLPAAPEGAGFTDRLLQNGREGLADLAGLGALALAADPLMAALTGGREPAHALAHAGVTAALLTFAYLAFGRFVLAPQRPGGSLLPVPDPRRHWRLYAAYGIAGPLIIESTRLAQVAGVERGALLSWAGLLATAITAYKVWWFWTIRRDIAAAIRGDAPGLAGRLAAVALPALLVALPIGIWLLGRVALAWPDTARLAIAAATTQVAVVLLPLAVAGYAALLRDLAARGGRSLAKAAGMALARSLGTGLIWIGGLVGLAAIWGIDALNPETARMAAVIRAVVTLSVIAIAGHAVLAVLCAVFDAYAPPPVIRGPSAEENKPAPAGRLATVLPVIRNLVMGAAVAVAVLIAMSSLGFDIAPLIAGAGVLGLALSFGSQALVRDIVSGVFYLADDAFRVGEYIDVGRAKGTVEGFTLRSIRLRHQNGMIHTIPFGQLGAITNFSRDWTTVKFNLRVAKDTDIELVRRTVKKIGIDLAADPEFAGLTLEPLKLQGVVDVTDTALVLRFKFTVRPTNPSVVQRQALRRIVDTFREKGIGFAEPTVTVAGSAGSNTVAAGAAAPAVLAAPQPVPLNA